MVMLVFKLSALMLMAGVSQAFFDPLGATMRRSAFEDIIGRYSAYDPFIKSSGGRSGRTLGNQPQQQPTFSSFSGSSESTNPFSQEGTSSFEPTESARSIPEQQPERPSIQRPEPQQQQQFQFEQFADVPIGQDSSFKDAPVNNNPSSAESSDFEDKTPVYIPKSQRFNGAADVAATRVEDGLRQHFQPEPVTQFSSGFGGNFGSTSGFSNNREPVESTVNQNQIHDGFHPSNFGSHPDSFSGREPVAQFGDRFRDNFGSPAGEPARATSSQLVQDVPRFHQKELVQEFRPSVPFSGLFSFDENNFKGFREEEELFPRSSANVNQQIPIGAEEPQKRFHPETPFSQLTHKIPVVIHSTGNGAAAGRENREEPSEDFFLREFPLFSQLPAGIRQQQTPPPSPSSSDKSRSVKPVIIEPVLYRGQLSGRPHPNPTVRLFDDDEFDKIYAIRTSSTDAKSSVRSGEPVVLITSAPSATTRQLRDHAYVRYSDPDVHYYQHYEDNIDMPSQLHVASKVFQ